MNSTVRAENLQVVQHNLVSGHVPESAAQILQTVLPSAVLAQEDPARALKINKDQSLLCFKARERNPALSQGIRW